MVLWRLLSANQREIEKREAEAVNIEEQYTSLQEEIQGKTDKLKKIFAMAKSVQGEIEDIQRVCKAAPQISASVQPSFPTGKTTIPRR